MDPQTLMMLIGQMAAADPKGMKNSSAQGTMFTKLLELWMNPAFQTMMGSAPSGQTQQVSTPLVDSYLNGKNETLKTAVQGLVSGQYSPQDAVALIMGDQSLSSYYNPASGGDISYWNSQVKAVMDEIGKAQQESAKTAADSPYAKLGVADPSLRYGTVNDLANGIVQVPADTSYYDYIVNRDGLANSSVGGGLQGPTTGGGAAQGDYTNQDPRNLPAMVQSGKKVKQQAYTVDAKGKATATTVMSPAVWDAGSVAAARQVFLQQQADQANAAGRTPFKDQAGQQLATLMKMFGMG